MGLTEHTGHGVPTIVSKYGKEVFEIDETYIRCIIPFDKNVVDSKSQNVGLNKTEQAIISLLIVKPDNTADSLAEIIGVSRRTIERNLQSLQKKGKLERIGSKRDGKWIVVS